MATTPPRKLHIALYSPGTVGLGHMRRNLLIAQVLAESALQSVNLLITEAREASAFVNSMPPGMDCLTLPGLSKGIDGVCRPRYLDLPLKEVIAMRARAIRAALKQFKPDLLIVDNLPRGAYRELDPALKLLKAAGHTRCVLGLRDVLDEPWSVHEAWLRWKNEAAIREYYDAIWVYGDPAIYNMVEEYRFPPSIASKIHFVGYLDQRRRGAFIATAGGDPFEQLSLPTHGLILCTVGGGQDGDRLAKAFSEAQLPADSCGAILTGPFMPAAVYDQLRRRAAANPRLRVLKFVNEPTVLMRHADRVVAMGGYNTVCEVLSLGKRALIVPRVGPRREQYIRAERLRRLGLIDMLKGEEVNPQALSEWFKRDLSPLEIDGRLNLNGLDRLPALVEEVLARRRQTALPP
ncbi:MAG: glycosyltransferase [Verrucomicrobiota bacterium]|nr:glycosyltransferase [Verrucomicrobiota bacterium]